MEPFDIADDIVNVSPCGFIHLVYSEVDRDNLTVGLDCNTPKVLDDTKPSKAWTAFKTTRFFTS